MDYQELSRKLWSEVTRSEDARQRILSIVLSAPLAKLAPNPVKSLFGRTGPSPSVYVADVGFFVYQESGYPPVQLTKDDLYSVFILHQLDDILSGSGR